MAIRGRSRVRAKRTTVDGQTFDSRAESRRYAELALLQRAGQVRDLVVHPVYRLTVNGVLVRRYTADFSYQEQVAVTAETGEWVLVVEDVKSRGTRLAQREWPMVKRLFRAIHGFDIRETGG